MRFLVDMPLSPAVAHWLTSLGHDAVHATGLGLFDSPDSIVLAVAIAEARIVVTADLDFPRLFSRLTETGPGLILLRSGNYTEQSRMTNCPDPSSS